MEIHHTLLFYIILVIFLIEIAIEFIFEELNRKSWCNNVPDRLIDVYPEDKFQKQKKYRIANYRFGMFSSIISSVIIVAVLWFEGFKWLDGLIAQYYAPSFLHPLIFFAIIGLVSMLLSLPFSIYDTFVIEERFGFNTTTYATFIGDFVKTLALGAILGGIILSLILCFYNWAGNMFWLYTWAGLTVFSIFMGFFYTTLIIPLFNKLTPLEDGNLRNSIEEMSNKTGFSIKNVFVMDGSKRSNKSNAFFSGFGKNKRIVLYDTLINELSTSEIVAVLAHEIGHYKMRHTVRGVIFGILQSGLMLYLLGWFINFPAISQALGVLEPSFHIGLLGFGLLYSPVSAVTGLWMTVISRKQEFQADAVAAKYSDSQSLGSALKKISASALSNPTPHPLYVFFNYSHPPLLKRLEALEQNTQM
jgi:STE24 endopeptidase